MTCLLSSQYVDDIQFSKLYILLYMYKVLRHIISLTSRIWKAWKSLQGFSFFISKLFKWYKWSYFFQLQIIYYFFLPRSIQACDIVQMHHSVIANVKLSWNVKLCYLQFSFPSKFSKKWKHNFLSSCLYHIQLLFISLIKHECLEENDKIV